MKKVGQSLGHFVVKRKWMLVVVSLFLLIPSVLGYRHTKINYDILVYLPKDIETMKGQDILAEDFDMGSFAICVVEDMPAKDILKFEKEFKEIEGVNRVISGVDIVGTTIPMEMLPEDILQKFKDDQCQLMLVTFQDSTVAINAIKEMRHMVDEQIKIGGMSASTLDTIIVAELSLMLFLLCYLS